MVGCPSGPKAATGPPTHLSSLTRSMSVIPDITSALKLPDTLALEYQNSNNAPLWLAKFKFFAKRYMAFRRVRGDGDCFYRAYLGGWMEVGLHSATVASDASINIDRVTEDLINHLPESLQSEFSVLAMELAERMYSVFQPEVQELEVALQTKASGAASKRGIRWLRLVISGYMRKNSELFEMISMAIEQPPGHTWTSFDDYLRKEVETMGCEADDLQQNALVNALRMSVWIENLQPGAAPSWSRRCGVHTSILREPDEPLGADALRVYMLYRPGHYDLFVPFAGYVPPEVARDELVPPVPPPPLPAQQATPCDLCRQQVMASCWLCAVRPACATAHGCARGLRRLPASFRLDSGGSGGFDAPVCVKCVEALPSATRDGTLDHHRPLDLLRCPTSNRLDFKEAMSVHLAEEAAAEAEALALAQGFSAATILNALLLAEQDAQAAKDAAEARERALPLAAAQPVPVPVEIEMEPAGGGFGFLCCTARRK